MRKIDGDGADVALGRIGRIVQGVGRYRALRIEAQLCRLGANKLHAGVREHRHLVEVVDDGPDVHQCRQLGDVLIALVQQRRRRRVGLAVVLELVVDERDLGHRVVRRDDGIVDAHLGVGAKVLNALGRRVERLRHGLRGAHRTDPRRLRVRAGRQSLEGGQELVERILDGAGFSRIAINILQIGEKGRADIGVGCAGGFRAQLRLQILIELPVDAVEENARTVVAVRAGDLDRPSS